MMTETVTIGSLLGIRLWDPWSPSVPPSTARMRAQHAMRPGRWQALVRSASDCHVLHSLPYLAGKIDAQHQTSVLVELDDPGRETLPMRLEASIPCDTFWSDIPSAFFGLAPATFVPTFAHPARTCPAGWVCLRADLRRESDSSAVPWALMEVRLGSDLMAIGMSTKDGALVAAFPAPLERARPATLASSEVFDAKRWTFSLTFRWHSSQIGSDSPSLTDLAGMQIVYALSTPATHLSSIECSIGETVLSTSNPISKSSFLFIQA